MSSARNYEYLGRFLDQLRAEGRFTFTGDEVKSEFDLNKEAYQKVIQRYLEKGRISRLRQNFYLIIPPEHAARQTLPLPYFIDDLMQNLKRGYYVGLITAAMFHGAAHQQPQKQYVVTEYPALRSIKNSRQSIVFCLKKGWASSDVERQKSDAGYFNVSTPSLTALDLILYVDKIGGMNRAATILAELVKSIKEESLAETAKRFNRKTILQRLGYLLEFVLQQQELADAVYGELETKKFYQTPLHPSRKSENQRAGNRWKVVCNINIEPDL